MQVNKNNVAQFLAANNTTFVIPVYQRNYDWTEENCKQLWSDISRQMRTRCIMRGVKAAALGARRALGCWIGHRGVKK